MSSKPSTCKCKSRNRWVCITRRKLPLTSRLKCLQCGWKWWSKCKYVAYLPDWVERSRSGMTDEMVLERINDGTIRVDIYSGRVFAFGCGHWKELKQIDRTSSQSTYQFVSISYKGVTKKVAVHRLVWMYVYRAVIDDGYDVDHIHGKNVKNANGIWNLRLLESSLNRSNSYGCEF